MEMSLRHGFDKLSPGCADDDSNLSEQKLPLVDFHFDPGVIWLTDKLVTDTSVPDRTATVRSAA